MRTLAWSDERRERKRTHHSGANAHASDDEFLAGLLRARETRCDLAGTSYEVREKLSQY